MVSQDKHFTRSEIDYIYVIYTGILNDSLYNLDQLLMVINSFNQEKFNVEAFADMVRSDYPAARQIERVEFGRVARDGRQALVQVYFFLPNGDIVPCVYRLVNEENAWKIDAAHVQKRWPSGRRLGGLRI